MYIKQDGANKKKRPTINKWIYRFLAKVSILIVVIPAGANVHYKIGVIHSYEKGYHDAERYHQTLEKELSTVGIKAEINDLFNHSDCADKVRNIAETGDIGELPDEFPVGVVHSAEHHGDIAQAGIIALQHGISGLIIENNDNIGSPIGQFIDKKRSTDKFILVSQFITIQEKIVD